jgi:acyl-CoA thioesterase-2
MSVALSFAAMMDLEAVGDDGFIASGPRTPWGVLYGGQVVAQAVRAAATTVGSGEHVHSVHASYVRAGDSAEPVELQVERVRDGRSFSVRSVRACQGPRMIVSALVSFHVEEGGGESSGLPAPVVPAPGELPSGGWTPMFDRRYAPVAGRARAVAWMRLSEPVIDGDPLLQACALTFMADDIPDDAVVALLHPERPPANTLDDHDWSIQTKSLDYSAWFHRPIETDGWLLNDFRCHALANSCAMVVGEVFTEDGAHVATIGQQVLVRRAD